MSNPLLAPIIRFDQATTRLAGRLAGRSRLVDRAMALSARYASVVAILLMLLLPCAGSGRPGSRWAALARIWAALALTMGLVGALGAVLRRTRPFAADRVGVPLVPHEPRRSFPSRHAACAATMTTVAFPASQRIGRWMAVVAGVLAVSRVYARLHYPSDVAGGALIGVLVGLILRQRSGP